MAAILTRTPGLASRVAALTRRERLFLGLGAAVALLLLVLILAGGEEEAPSVELGTPPAGQQAASTLPPPPPAPIVASAPMVAPAPPASAEGLVLHGVLGSGAAVIGLPGGTQRFVRMGGQVTPGLVLKEVALKHVVLGGAGGDLRLEFNRPAVAQAATPAPSATPAGTGDRQPGREATQYRLGLAARRAGGRITGYTVKPGAELPALHRAGLKPGDVLVSVNGMAFDSDEKVLELPGEIAGSYTAEFEFERGGRRMKTGLEVNPRAQR